MKLFSSLRNNPIESLAALVLVAGGVYVSSIGSSVEANKTGLLTAGGLLTTFGGVLFAWIVSKAFATTQARAEFQQQLGHLSRNLGQAGGQISRAVEQSQAGEISSETGLALISQANRMIYGQVSEISVIQGTGFDSAYLLETAATLDGLARQLETSTSEADELEEVRRQLKQVRSSLSAAPSRTFSSVEIPCPYCHELNEVELGDFAGDSASTLCTKCQSQFNAHRRADGSAFSRPIGPAARRDSQDSERWSFECPSCGRLASVRSGSGMSTMVCLRCLHQLLVDNGLRTVELGSTTYARRVVPIVGRYKSKPVVQCSECGRAITAFFQVEDHFSGVCHRDRRVLEVPQEEFEEWVAGLPDEVARTQDMSKVLPIAQAGTPADGRQ